MTEAQCLDAARTCDAKRVCAETAAAHATTPAERWRAQHEAERLTQRAAAHRANAHTAALAELGTVAA